MGNALGPLVGTVILIVLSIPFGILTINLLYRITGKNKHQNIGKMTVWWLISSIPFVYLVCEIFSSNEKII